MTTALLRRIAYSSFGVWIILGVVGGYLLFNDFNKPAGQKRLKFGIDLVGGTYITLELDAQSLVQSRLRSMTSFDLQLLAKDGIKPTATEQATESVTYTFATDSDALRAQEVFGDLRDQQAKIERDNLKVTVRLTDAALKKIYQDAQRTNVEILRRRLNSIGAEEISVVPQGEKNIIVELPDIHDVAQAKAMIGTPAVLEFKLVEDSAASREALLAKYDGEVPAGMMIMPGDARGEGAWYLVHEYTAVTGESLQSAHPGYDPQRHTPTVEFKLNAEGARAFKELTGQNIGRQLAVVLDGKAIQVATIQSEIEGAGMITGPRGEEAQRLSLMLRSGAFAGKMKFAEERRIGSSLGKEAIKSGLLSCLIGLALLFAFAVFYYKLAGVFAILALVYNLGLILFCMYLFGGTLTLPGIAGMVLTIGMAIDSSILIYEKIKELLAQGMAVSAAVDEGFSDAMAVILDSNITHFLTALVLYKFSNGPVRGFALALMIGIFATLVTGILFLRSIFTIWLSRKNVQKLSI